MRLRLHSNLEFAQRIKVLGYTEEHHDEMLVSVETLT